MGGRCAKCKCPLEGVDYELAHHHEKVKGILCDDCFDKVCDEEPRVLNKTHDFIPASAVYIGRPSKWGNPFSHLQNSRAQFQTETREQAIAAYKEWILTQPELVEAAKRELQGKDLVCWCSPKPCHGEVLLEIANS